MGRLDGKKALVTGASRGIGRAIAIELAKEGAEVAINYQSSDAKAEAVVEEIGKLGGKAILAKANLSDPESARAMIADAAEKLGGLDILVNNAGITRDRSLRKMSDEQWQEVISTNLNPYFYCSSAAIPLMMDGGFGRIVNVSSMNGQTGAFGQANYSASKGGIIAFTKTSALGAGQGQHYGKIALHQVSPKPTCLPKCPIRFRTRLKHASPWDVLPSPKKLPKPLPSW